MEKVEKEIVKWMLDKKHKKIRLPDKSIWEAKYLKTAGAGGKGGFVLRRGKL